MLAGLYHSAVLLGILFHLCHITEAPDGNSNQRGQRHAPVQHKQIDHDGDWYQKIGGHLRYDMGQRDLKLFHPLNDGTFQLPGRSCC